MSSKLVQSPIWKDLQVMASKRQACDLYEDIALPDPITAGGIEFDFSNHHCGVGDMQALLQLADQQQVTQWRDRMVQGEVVNRSENRQVGHIWLRAGEREEVLQALDKMRVLSHSIRTEKRFKHIVNIGIGGSDLGPRMIADALGYIMPDQPVSLHYVANIDPLDLTKTLRNLDPKQTLFIICSKTMTTMETMENMRLAKSWLEDGGVKAEAMGGHFIGVSTNQQAMDEIGIPADQRLGFWDWVGGRYSLWSVIGISVAIGYGFDVFEALLNGAKAMDDHFIQAQPEANVPIISALLGVWYRNFFAMPGWAIHPYSEALELLIPYLQQLDMESNGKSVTRDGAPVDYETGPIVFGQVGSKGQHAIAQWLHQGTTIVPGEFIGVKNTTYDQASHQALKANMQAQSVSLAGGRRNDSEPHRHFPGRRPSTQIWLETLSASHLGSLLAYYEHRTFVQGIIWELNSFDQWGVELGKAMAKDILAQG